MIGKGHNIDDQKLSDERTTLITEPKLSQIKHYKDHKEKFYKFSIPQELIKNGKIIPDKKYYLTIREILV
jgi:hypothetical protein